ncbi:MAG: PorT family protein [Candidatus Amulumruptor caecigallinarius]|nr:PorT family protein [Candidatus Amulumruptor caecigallinarius]MCM1396706.1 PorT family protein [Candidatus Amulumruptor caecigallinarius]MCM1453236.1 PorT family protein [bacterium]
MKKTLLAMVAAVAAVIAFSQPAQAQFRFGIKAGLDVNSLHFNEKLIDSDNRAGFTGGIMCEFTAPLIGVGMDVSAMYTRRDLKAVIADNGLEQTVKSHRDYIEIPVNLKYKMNIPAINKIIRPMLFTGPSFAFLTSRTGINNALKNKEFDCTWNFGFGAELFSHLQVAASYGIGLNNSVVDRLGLQNIDIDGKTKVWTVTAAYLF